MQVEDKLAQLGLVLPPSAPPAGNYVGAVLAGNLLFVSGHGPHCEDRSYITGKVGRDLTTEEAYDAAKVVMLNCLASIKREVGDLDRVKRIVKLLGMVNCTADFTAHPQVNCG
jgi:enamine deaminase RidA (YjgF/YER057c/UK114 family)